MILSRIIKRITKITKFEVINVTTVFKWKMPFFYSQEGVKGFFFIKENIGLIFGIALISTKSEASIYSLPRKASDFSDNLNKV